MIETRRGARALQARVECPRESEVFDAVAFGRWPDRSGPSSGDRDLVRHVAACAICADLVEVVRALHDDGEAACREAHVPAAGMVWWRATIRARADAARTAMQPISVLQSVAGACAVGLAAGLVSVAWRSIHWVDRFGDLIIRLESRRVEIGSAPALAVAHGLPVLLGLAACLVLAPLALYVTLADD